MTEPRIELKGKNFSDAWEELVKTSEELKLSGVCTKCPNQKLCHSCAAMAEAERLKNIYSESIAGARDEAQRIVTDARRSAQDQADAILAEARAEAAVLREKAEADIVSEKKKAVNEIKDEISDIAILIAEKVVEKEITPADHEKLIAQFIDRVGE